MVSFVTRYDFRVPGGDAATRQEVYARSLQQAAYVDAHGQDAIMLSEHHASDDGYLPSPLLVASAMAAVTSRVPITVAALLVNLHDPLRLAEDIAVLDHLAAGRVSLTFGLGYREVEYDLFDRSWRTRGRDVEERITAVLDAWATGRVTPRPFSDPHPFLLYGGGTPAAARRAARLGLSFQPQHSDPALREEYVAACRELGREPGVVLTAPPGPANVFCAERPEEFWERWGHHLLADAAAYQSWHGDAASHVLDPSRSVEEMQEAGVYLVVTPEDLVERVRSREVRLVTCHPACGGLPAEPSWASLRLVCETVMPAVRA
ncbi:LLM class flavin-dependent oxidoreductase [Nocardioides sp. NPDC092400]|uniref:LLM class flavin-dependent oxidoreductase n=1 Tax=Nocardioides sp. NPDC092400 TaxID=3155196 RepID=UPI00341C13DA